MTQTSASLTPRQLRERDYHKDYARTHRVEFSAVSYDLIEAGPRRWWNAYWALYTLLLRHNLAGKRVLVVGCGFGADAFRLARLGARVDACDLSPDLIAAARETASREGLRVEFGEMPAEELQYEDDSFDCVLASDILHHVDLQRCLAEIGRVSRNGALLVVNEIYTHSRMERIRHSAIVEKWLYPRLVKFVYGTATPYITVDERKLCEQDVRAIRQVLDEVSIDYFYFLNARLFPTTLKLPSQLDRAFLVALKPVAHLLAGRVLLSGIIRK